MARTRRKYVPPTLSRPRRLADVVEGRSSIVLSNGVVIEDGGQAG